MKRGTWLAVAAYLIWGLLPIFWKQLHHLPPLEILGHRMIWSFAFLAMILAHRGQWPAWRAAFKNKRTRHIYMGTGAIISGNWLTFIWAINNGYLVEASLGYFLNPLITVLLGVLFLKEKLRRMQWVALGLVLAGVAIPMLQYGRVPWIALILAFSFAFYSLLKKSGPLESIPSMGMETGWMLIPGLTLLIVLQVKGQGAMGHAPAADHLFLFLTGLATAGPLLLFTAAARIIPLSRIGVLQYIAPTLQFILGITLYHEPFTRAQAIGFSLVWAAIAVYLGEGLYASRKNQGMS